ncbi:FAD-dependent oxidoreductase, partial [Chamaesiphon sp. VAR_48_metabat_403]|uniref:FAD-dependent oxidoreductase n=1 Tax=Chamaesiphon sp. VAR_48_metabat_403 TaxID=2964700 RepID=UPI00286E96F8
PILTPEYDLLFIGATAAARAAAIEAVNLQARVALVLPQLADERLHPQRDFYPYALARIANTHRIERTRLQQPTSYPWKYAEAAIDRLDRQCSPAMLAAMGVDTIVGMGEFCRRPHLAFNIENRSLRARAYLIATGTISHYPLIPGIQAAGYMVLDRLPSLVVGVASLKENRQIPLRWAIVGSESVGVELAQTLAKLGCRVALIVETERILPYEDPDLTNLIQAQLEADGVEIYLETIVTNVDMENRAKLVTLGDETIAVDEIFIALPDRPRLESFNLLGVGVDYTEKGISIDNKLQTSHQQIYACGGVCGNVLGGYHSQSLTEYEAKIAVRNALSWRKTKIDYNSYQNLPWAVYTDPPLARVGMTLSMATNSNRRDRIVLQSYLKDSPQAILNGINSGFCQIIVTPNGRILGAEIFGHNAPELIQTLAISIHNRLNIADLTTVPCLSPSYTEFIYQTAQEWHRYQRQQRQKLTWIERLCWWK